MLFSQLQHEVATCRAECGDARSMTDNALSIGVAAVTILQCLERRELTRDAIATNAGEILYAAAAFAQQAGVTHVSVDDLRALHRVSTAGLDGFRAASVAAIMEVNQMAVLLVGFSRRVIWQHGGRVPFSEMGTTTGLIEGILTALARFLDLEAPDITLDDLAFNCLAGRKVAA